MMLQLMYPEGVPLVLKAKTNRVDCYQEKMKL